MKGEVPPMRRMQRVSRSGPCYFILTCNAHSRRKLKPFIAQGTLNLFQMYIRDYFYKYKKYRKMSWTKVVLYQRGHNLV